MSVEANLEAAFELANKWREESGQDILAAWLPSHPVDGKKCLLARAFNLNCDVGYHRDDANSNSEDVVGTAYPWSNIHNYNSTRGLSQMISGSGTIEFDEPEDAALFAEITGYELFNENTVALPDEIALVAWEFDNGQYREYAVEPETE